MTESLNLPTYDDSRDSVPKLLSLLNLIAASLVDLPPSSYVRDPLTVLAPTKRSPKLLTSSTLMDYKSLLDYETLDSPSILTTGILLRAYNPLND